jgi:flagellar biosynthesis GTPase FlhF
MAESTLNLANQFTMEIRTYRAESVHEALQMVRDELGPDAIVLRTREVRAGGLWGLIRGDRCTELTASTDLPALEPWLRPSGAMDRGIDLSGPVAFRVRSPRNEHTQAIDERHLHRSNEDSETVDFEQIGGGK